MTGKTLIKPALPGFHFAVWYIGITIALASTNVPLVFHYLGLRATAIYLLAFLALSLVCLHLPDGLTQGTIMAAVVLISVVAQMAALHIFAPLFDNRMDRDSALVSWLHAIKQGQYPYRVSTDLGNPISVLPFMPILSLPFYLIGNVGYLPIFAYLVLTGLLWHTYRNAPSSRFFSICALSSAPLLFFEVIGRSDLIANMSLLISLLCWMNAHQGQAWGRKACLMGVLLGCLAATRFALFPVLALIALYMWRTLPRPTFIKVSISAIFTFGLLVLPFIVWDGATFVNYAPLGVNATKLGNSITTRAGWSLGTGFAVLILGMLVRQAHQLFLGTALVLTLVMVATWSTFFRDLSYLQLPFIPLLFALPATYTLCYGDANVG